MQFCSYTAQYKCTEFFSWIVLQFCNFTHQQFFLVLQFVSCVVLTFFSSTLRISKILKCSRKFPVCRVGQVLTGHCSGRNSRENTQIRSRPVSEKRSTSWRLERNLPFPFSFVRKWRCRLQDLRQDPTLGWAKWTVTIRLLGQGARHTTCTSGWEKLNYNGSFVTSPPFIFLRTRSHN